MQFIPVMPSGGSSVGSHQQQQQAFETFQYPTFNGPFSPLTAFQPLSQAGQKEQQREYDADRE
jgi:hypothetical protein